MARGLWSAGMGLALGVLAASLVVWGAGLALAPVRAGDAQAWSFIRNSLPLAAFAVPGAIAAMVVAETQGWRATTFWLPFGALVAGLGWATLAGSGTAAGAALAHWSPFLVLLCAGLAGGLTYWLVYGRRTGAIATALAAESSADADETTARGRWWASAGTVLLLALVPLSLLGWSTIYGPTPPLAVTLKAAAEAEAKHRLAEAGLPWARLKIEDGLGMVEGRAPDRTTGRFAFAKAERVLGGLTGLFGVVGELEDDIVSP